MSCLFVALQIFVVVAVMLSPYWLLIWLMYRIDREEKQIRAYRRSFGLFL